MDGASVDVKELAGRNRQAIFNQLGDSSIVLVATQPHHVFYCSGYKSMGFDTSWLLKMAVVFVADDWISRRTQSRPLVGRRGRRQGFAIFLLWQLLLRRPGATRTQSH
ncbi:hypothetical protein ACHMW7_01850 (plasmid) [Aminobacter sp. UC22_36]|uniref:hypothetical protein n=1 Tax=Aminobacter sp. UC22_36 TaxID=3374549 RepID=UPI0037575032